MPHILCGHQQVVLLTWTRLHIFSMFSPDLPWLCRKQLLAGLCAVFISHAGGATECLSAGAESSAGEETYSIGFAPPEEEAGVWDFLLLRPSPRHTAALCLQRRGALAAGDSCDSEEGCDIAWEGDEVMSCADSAQGLSADWTDADSRGSSGSTAGDVHAHGAATGLTLRCWRTVPLVREALMDQEECVVLGS